MFELPKDPELRQAYFKRVADEVYEGHLEEFRQIGMPPYSRVEVAIQVCDLFHSAANTDARFWLHIPQDEKRRVEHLNAMVNFIREGEVEEAHLGVFHLVSVRVRSA